MPYPRGLVPSYRCTVAVLQAGRGLERETGNENGSGVEGANLKTPAIPHSQIFRIAIRRGLPQELPAA